MFTAEGPGIVRELTAMGKSVFVDLKMYDISETVKKLPRGWRRLARKVLTVHSSPQVIRAAMQGAQGSELKIVAVTVLTSFARQDLEDLGVAGQTVGEQVNYQAAKGIGAGVDGFVCSPLEVAGLRALAGPGKVLVTPGVRSIWRGSRGPRRGGETPAEAISAGADYLVIGREITRAVESEARK